MIMILASLLGVLMGIALGVLGAGGSIMAVPIFVYVLQVEPKAAIAMSLAVVGATAAIGAWTHGRAGQVRMDVALIFGPVAMLGTYLGARLATLMTGDTQLVLFAVVMFVASFFMGRSDGLVSLRADESDPNAPVPGRTARVWAGALLGLEGLGVGVLTGIVGVGGGFLIVPALVLLAGIPMREAVGTSLLVIAFKSGAGFVGYLDQVAIDWLAMGVFTIAAAGGIFGGTVVGRRLPVLVLRRTFAGFLAAMAVLILYMEVFG